MAKKGGASPNNLRFLTERTVQVNLRVTGSQVPTEGNLKRCQHHDIGFQDLKSKNTKKYSCLQNCR